MSFPCELNITSAISQSHRMLCERERGSMGRKIWSAGKGARDREGGGGERQTRERERGRGSDIIMSARVRTGEYTTRELRV